MSSGLIIAPMLDGELAREHNRRLAEDIKVDRLLGKAKTGKPKVQIRCLPDIAELLVALKLRQKPG